MRMRDTGARRPPFARAVSSNRPFAAWGAMAALCLFLCGIAGAQGAPRTIHVDASHTGASDGSSARPFTSIGAAIEQAESGRGDTILVRPGEYAEAVRLPANTTLRSEAGATHTFITGGEAAFTDLVLMGDNSVLRGFSLGTSPGTGAFVPTETRAEITNCVFYANDIGVQAATEGDLNLINNTFYQNRIGLRGGADAVLNPVRNNIFARNETGVFIVPGATLVTGYNAFDANTLNFENALPSATDIASQALFVDPENLNFHLRIFSRLRNAGDPAPAFTDRDNTRNNIGADGGPHGVIDTLAPVARIRTSPSPPAGQAPFLVELDGRESSDEWGIAFYEWDLDASDGFTPEVTEPVTLATYGAPGQYVATLRVTDNSGLKSTAQVAITVGAPPEATALAVPNIGTAPLTVQFSAAAPENSPLSFAWDFDGAGEPESTERNAVFTYPADTPPGNYFATLTVQDGSGAFSQVRVPITITEYPVPPGAVLEHEPGADAAIDVTAPGSGVDGFTLDVPGESYGEPLVFGLAPLAPGDAPFLPGGTLAAIFSLDPAGIILSAPVTIGLPLPPAAQDPRVFRYDAGAQAWFDTGISRVRVHESANGPRLSFDTAQGALFAVVWGEGTGENGGPPAGCPAGTLAAGPGARLGNGLVLALGAMLILFAPRRRAPARAAFQR